MSDNPPILVDNDPFFGRIEEQKQFIAALQDVLIQPATETLPYIFLLYGDGGMGKTTLAKRFRDIASDRPFRGMFQMLWIDWEDEKRKGYPALQVGRENITPETVFDMMHMAAVRSEWGAHFKAYQDALKLRDDAEKKAAEVLVAADERDELAQIRGLGATAIAKIIRLGVPAIGETGEKLAQAFLNEGIKVGAEQAARLRGQIETRLRARLDPAQFKAYLYPIEQLANALADGLKKVATSAPLLVFLDTYELVDRADTQLRLVIRAAGPRVIWIISGRDDLVQGRQFGAEYFKGYADDFARRLLPYNMRQLAIDDICAYFDFHASQSSTNRSLSDEEVEAVSRATRGIPLAVREAADIWMKGNPLSDIVGDTTDYTPRDQIVGKMTDRYLLHVVADADRKALYALALARGDVEVLRAMLQPPDGMFDLDTLLHRLERDYASVHAERARLHNEPALFLCEYLKADVRRTGEPARAFNQRAAAALRERLAKLEADLPLIEDRCENEDWAKAALRLTYHLFWLDEIDSWHWFVPRFVESLAYSHELRNGLLQVADEWRDHLSQTGKKRLKALMPSDDRTFLEDDEVLLAELTQLETKGWLKGDGEAERHAILDLRRGQLLYRQEKYADALTLYKQLEPQLPAEGNRLREQLGGALSSLCVMLPNDGKNQETIVVYEYASRLHIQNASAYHGLGHAYDNLRRGDDAVSAFQYAIEIEPNDAAHYHCLGNVYRHLGRTVEAIATFQRAIELDPTLAYPHTDLGDVYGGLGRTDEAIAAYHRAIELDPKSAYPHTGLGNVYRTLGRTDEAIAAYQRAIELDPKSAYPHNGLGKVYVDLDRTDEAIAAYQRAIDLDPKYAYPHNGLGNVYRTLGRTDEAIAEYKSAIEIDPKHVQAYHGLGHLYQSQNRNEDALTDFQSAIELKPNEAYLYNDLGNVYRTLGRTDEAIAAYQRAIELDPKSAYPHNGLGKVYVDLDRTDEAIAAYQRAIDLDPKYAYPHNGLGNVYRTLGRTDEAIAEYQKAIDLDAKYATPHQGLGIVYQSLGQSEKASVEFKKAVELGPNDGSFRASLVGILKKLGREAEAAEHLNIARELIVKETEYNRACFEAIYGNVGEALELLKQAIAKAPGDRLSARRDPDFDNIRSDPRFIALVGEADEKPSTDAAPNG